MADATPAATPAEDAKATSGPGADAPKGNAKPKAPAKPKPGDVFYDKGPAGQVYEVRVVSETRSVRKRIDGPNGELPPGVVVK